MRRTAWQQFFHATGGNWRHKAGSDASHGGLGAAPPTPPPLGPVNASSKQQSALCRFTQADLNPHAVRKSTAPITCGDAQRKHRVSNWIETRAYGIGNDGQCRHGGTVPPLRHHRTIAKNDETTRSRPQVLAVPQDGPAVGVVAALPTLAIERKNDVMASVGKKPGSIDRAQKIGAMRRRRARSPG
ncbi:hypothetical protein [Acidovorax sp. K2F]|uniref:hypothetical protein n=1 Tax=Acidovorax sp. K2F TaxID=2978125 RepID=UPI0021B0A0CC|nr:hypothetical protein [Acidovorax sp. K2F]MCT6720017.1 hypothetical protein [Acidovorax sp. K2F]